MKSATRTDSREAILAAATDAVMTEGYNALSFRDLAAEVGIKSASVHYHFPTKGDLAEALVKRFAEDFVKMTGPLREKSYEEAIDGYIAMFRRAFLGRNRMCLGGMMSAEVSALPPLACEQLRVFADAHGDFLRSVLLKKYPRIAKDKLDSRAMGIFAAMEGAQLTTRGLGGDVEVFDRIVADYRASGLFG